MDILKDDEPNEQLKAFDELMSMIHAASSEEMPEIERVHFGREIDL
jgi:hypothetical protein